MRLAPLSALVLLSCTAARAQETNWVASRFSVELHEIDNAGRVLTTINLAANVAGLRSVHRAPDGKLWVVNFIQPFFTIVDPVTQALVNVTNPLGNPFEIAFDAQGHAWVSGGTGVVEYDAAGVQIASYPLPAAAPLGITVDNMGNKWIAHRTAAPGSISRIDPTGAVTNHVPPAGGIQPTDLIADFRGLLVPSHIWVVGDNAVGDVYHFDGSGNFVNLVSTGSQCGSIVQDAAGRIWAGSFSNGNVFEIDPNTTMVVNTFNVAPAVNGLAVDGFNNLWVTSRIGFNVPPPSEVRRIDKNTGTIQVPAVVGIGTQSALATLFHHAQVVDPLGDLDGDGIPNYVELQNGDSPFDACSARTLSATIRGSTRLGTTATLDFVGPNLYGFAVAFGTVAPGTGLRLPGIGCELLLQPATFVPGGSVVGPASLPLFIPNVAGLDGTVLFMQALGVSATPSFTNVSALKVWM